jgi:energy-coupling factor transporter ATP-binding protein EcfA2
MAISDEIRAHIVGLSEGGKKRVEIAASIRVHVRIV